MRRLLVAGALALAAAACTPATAHVAPGAIAMDHSLFRPASATVVAASRLTFTNTSSRAVHVLVVGTDAHIRSEPGAPAFGGSAGVRTDVGRSWTSGPWRTPGTYHVTCTLHPSMNLTVRVVPST
ncbi:MAG TPA: hypothetical protein VFJ85_06175 [Acidimicrobiales bacterium]|nr:hypothetical protein [Acidimicrobiales bacterium]